MLASKARWAGPTGEVGWELESPESGETSVDTFGAAETIYLESYLVPSQMEFFGKYPNGWQVLSF